MFNQFSQLYLGVSDHLKTRGEIKKFETVFKKKSKFRSLKPTKFHYGQ